jgi:hypothetical protein
MPGRASFLRRRTVSDRLAVEFLLADLPRSAKIVRASEGQGRCNNLLCGAGRRGLRQGGGGGGRAADSARARHGRVSNAVSRAFARIPLHAFMRLCAIALRDISAHRKRWRQRAAQSGLPHAGNSHLRPPQDSRSDHFESCLSTRLKRILLEGQIGSAATVYWLVPSAGLDATAAPPGRWA